MSVDPVDYQVQPAIRRFLPTIDVDENGSTSMANGLWYTVLWFTHKDEIVLLMRPYEAHDPRLEREIPRYVDGIRTYLKPYKASMK